MSVVGTTGTIITSTRGADGPSIATWWGSRCWTCTAAAWDRATLRERPDAVTDKRGRILRSGEQQSHRRSG